jgi:hypothetical protein
MAMATSFAARKGGDEGTTRRTMRRPNLGVYLDRSPIDIDPRGMRDCRNVRILNKRLRSDGLGWDVFPELQSFANRINLDGEQCRFIGEHVSQAGSRTLMLANKNDIFRYNAIASPPEVKYLTPIYSTGTVTSGGTENKTITGVDTFWDTNITTLPTADGYGKNAKAGYMIAFGDASEVALDATWYEIDAVAGDTELTVLTDPGSVSGADYTIRQKMQCEVTDIWNAVTFKGSLDASPSGADITYITNGVDMMWWDGADAQVTWFYPGFIGKRVFVYKQSLAFNHITESGNKKISAIRYTQLLHPENFATLGAGEIVAADAVTELYRVMPIGDQIACYHGSDVILLQYVGAPLYYIARVALPGVGIVGPGALIDHGNYHSFISHDAAYKFDGVSSIEHAPQVFREVLRTIAPDRIEQTYAYQDKEHGEIIWSVPLTTDGQADPQPPVTAYVEHYLEDVGPNLPVPMTIRDFPFTAVGTYERTGALTFADYPESVEGQFDQTALRWDDRNFQDQFPQLIAGDDDGNVWILNESNSRNGGGFLSYAKFPRFAVGDGEYKGLIHRVEPHTTTREGATDYTLYVRLTLYDSADGGYLSTSVGNFDMSQKALRYVPMRTAARYAALTYWTSGADQPWDLGGHEVKVSPLGSR